MIIIPGRREHNLLKAGVRGRRVDFVKDLSMWIEQAHRKRKCHRCGGAIEKDLMFVRVGERERPRRSTCMCPLCFEKIMDDLSQNFQDIKGRMFPVEHVELDPEQEREACQGPRCFACGLAPEKCRCGWESYR